MSFITPYYPVNQSGAKQNREAFERALSELDDYEMRDRLCRMIYRLADALVRERKVSRETALAQATEFIGACVWAKARGR